MVSSIIANCIKRVPKKGVKAIFDAILIKRGKKWKHGKKEFLIQLLITLVFVITAGKNLNQIGITKPTAKTVKSY